MKISKGFTAVEGLLILVIIGILAGLGWYVWDNHKKTTKTAAQTSTLQTAQASSNTPAPDPTADWTTYTSKTGVYTIKYPKTWVIGTTKECTGTDDSLLLLGADANSTGHYCADGPSAFGQIFVGSYASGTQSQPGNLPEQDRSATVTFLTIDGVKVQKSEGTGIDANKTKFVYYTAFTNNRDYTFSYVYSDDQGKAYPNVVNDFNTMVTKTLKFSAN